MLVLVVGVGGLVLLYSQIYSEDDLSPAEKWAEIVSEAVEETVDMASSVASGRRISCHFYNSDCFDVYRCGTRNGKLKGRGKPSWLANDDQYVFIFLSS